MPDFPEELTTSRLVLTRIREGDLPEFLNFYQDEQTTATLGGMRAADWVRRIRTSNMRKAPPLPPELRKELTSRFREDIVRTSGLIGRSLDHWL